jgi:hypothetical protein
MATAVVIFRYKKPIPLLAGNVMGGVISSGNG